MTMTDEWTPTGEVEGEDPAQLSLFEGRPVTEFAVSASGTITEPDAQPPRVRMNAAVVSAYRTHLARANRRAAA